MNTMERLAELTAQRGMTLFQLAQKSNISYNTLKSAKTRGGQLSVDTIEVLCGALDITMSDFFAARHGSGKE